jgi:DNA-binding XRE family transcriptional regulator
METLMYHRSRNLVTGRQLRAARTLAGMTQKDLAAALDVNERAVRFLVEETRKSAHFCAK